MGFHNITLLFDRTTHAFTPGQNITGKVRFDVSGSTIISGKFSSLIIYTFFIFSVSINIFKFS